eukprot:sb/3463400/
MPARLCAEHMLLVACLSANIGAEFVSPLLEELAGKFRSELGTDRRGGKILNNIVSMVCFMYSLKVVSCVLVFDIIRALLASFTEPDLEVLLYIFKSVGVDIRKDDPQALKDIVNIVNEKGSKLKEKSSRFTWFVDTLTAVKNNNINKIPNYDKSDIVDIQKAFKATVKANPPNLQVTLSDLQDAATKGRWWVVGAAWTGTEEGSSERSKKTSNIGSFDSKLLALAKKNHMNTEVRRNVFCVLMSSEDFEHCFEQLMKLNLKDKQEREIIHVAVLCALKCKTYNPYYTSVIGKFCGFSKNFQVTTQFSLWDRLKELQSLSPAKLSNLTKLLAALITSKTISLAVLKVVNFAEIGTDDVTFFKDLFTALLSNSEGVVTEIFGRVQPLPLDNLKNEVRRNVFCVLMSSEDFEHCFEQLMKLNLKDKQEREIIHVAVLCALKCKTYNPYYTSVIGKFCGFSKNFQVTTQFSLWDRLKELQSLSPAKLSNLTKLLAALITSKTISLAVLKVVNFAEIGTDDVTFFKDLFTALLSNSEGVVTEIFGRVQPLPLDNLKNGMKVFMKHFDFGLNCPSLDFLYF